MLVDWEGLPHDESTWVDWEGLPHDESTWVDWLELVWMFPNMDLEDKVLVKGGITITTPSLNHQELSQVTRGEGELA